MTVHHLDDDTISGLLDLGSVTDAVRDAFAAWGTGAAATTARVRAATGGAMASAMAAVVPPFSGGKVYATHGGDFTFVNVLFDERGRLLCTLDGDALTRLRTPAGCAVAVRALAAPGAATAAVLGSGRQAWPHIEMLLAELPAMTGLAVHARRPEAAAELVDRARAAGAPARVAVSADDAVAGADVIVTVTRAAQPLFAADAVADRALICAVGATKADRCEIPPGLVARCGAVVCDDVNGSRTECGDLLRAEAAGCFDWRDAVELHAVAAGRADVARAGTAPVLFETQGVALQDVAAAALAWQRHVANHAERPVAGRGVEAPSPKEEPT